jgi:hypothetical protein
MMKSRNNNLMKSEIRNPKSEIVSLFRHIVISLIIVLFLGIQNSFASSIWDKGTVISPPVGTDVLPGGNLSAENIKEHAIFSKVIPFLIDYAIRIAIALSVIVLIFGGYQYMTAYGATEKQDNARKTVTYAAIGLIVSLTAYAIIAIITSIQLT